LKAGITQAGFKEIFHGLPAELAAHWRKGPLMAACYLVPWISHFMRQPDCAGWHSIPSGVSGHAIERWRVIPAHKLIFHFAV
jgi:hypothetical protein